MDVVRISGIGFSLLTKTYPSQSPVTILRSDLEIKALSAHMLRAGLPDMTINAHVISGLDPGAVPGDSTIKLSPVSTDGRGLFSGVEIGSTDV